MFYILNSTTKEIELNKTFNTSEEAYDYLRDYLGYYFELVEDEYLVVSGSELFELILNGQVKIPLYDVDLSSANLMGVDLSSANLTGADLRGTTLITFDPSKDKQ